MFNYDYTALYAKHEELDARAEVLGGQLNEGVPLTLKYIKVFLGGGSPAPLPQAWRLLRCVVGGG